MLEQSSDHPLVVLDLLFILLFLGIELLLELGNFFFFGSQNLEFTSVLVVVCLSSKLIRDFTHLSLVSLDHLSHFSDFLLLLLNLSVILLDTVHQTLTSLREWQVHLIGLEF